MTLEKFLELNSKIVIVTILLFMLTAGKIYINLPLVRIGGNIYFADIFILYSHFLVILIALHTVLSKGSLRLNFVELLILLFYLTLLFGIVRGLPKYGVSAYGIARNTGLYSSFVVLAYFAAYRTQLKSIRKTIKYLALLCISISLYGYVINLFTTHPEPHRAFGIFRVLIISIYFLDVVYDMIRNKKSSTWIYIKMLVLAVLIIISSQRAIWVAVAFLFGVYYLYNLKSISFKSYILLFIGLLGIIGIYYNLPNSNSAKKNIEARFIGIVNPQVDVSSTTRLIVWADALKDFIGNPIMGQGVGESKEITFEGGGIEGIKIKRVLVHNVFLSVAEERGIVGLAPFVLVFLVFLRKYIAVAKSKSYTQEYRFVPAVAMIFVNLFFWNDQPFLWLMIGVQLALEKKQALAESKT